MCIEFNMCCFTISLRTGSLLMGYINLIVSGAKNYWSIVNLLTLVTEMMENNLNPLEPLNVAETATTAIVLIVLILQNVNFIFSIAILIGLYMEQDGIISAYISFGSFYLILNTLVVVGNGFVDSFQASISYITSLIIIAHSIYFLNIIRSYNINIKCLKLSRKLVKRARTKDGIVP